MSTSRQRTLIVCLLLVAAVAAVYQPVTGYDFILLDDRAYVVENPLVTGGISPAGIASACTTLQCGYWMPLTWLSLQLDYELYGNNPGGFHATNVLLHAVNAVVLFLLLSVMTSSPLRSAMVAGLFALHPIHVESVAWVAERKDVLSTLFFLLTVLLYRQYVAGRSFRCYWCAVLLFAAGMAAKPMGVTLPLLLLLLDFWPLRRFGAAQAQGGSGRSLPPAFACLVEKIPFAGIAGVMGVVTLYAQQQVGAVAGLQNITLYSRLHNAAISYVQYVYSMAAPFRLAVFYPHAGNELSLTAGVAAAAALIVVTAGALVLFRKAPWLTTGWLWFAVSLFPVSGIAQAGMQARADRFVYVPAIGLYIAIVWAVANLPAWQRLRKPVVVLLCAAVLCVPAVLARGQVRHWQNSTSLFTHTLKVTGPNFLIHNNLGYALYEAGLIDDAIAQYYEALQIRPRAVEIHNNLALAYVEKGNLQRAGFHYEKALKFKPGVTEIHNNLGLLYIRLQKQDKALEQFSAAIQSDPQNAVAHYNMANLLMSQNRVSKAIEHYRAAVACDPGQVEFRAMLNAALRKKARQ